MFRGLHEFTCQFKGSGKQAKQATAVPEMYIGLRKRLTLVDKRVLVIGVIGSIVEGQAFHSCERQASKINASRRWTCLVSFM